MYNFWFECFQIEYTGGCNKIPIKKHLTSFMILFIFIFILIIIYFIWKYFQKIKRTHRSPTTLLPYPNRISA
jgi:amino acid permease